MSRAKRYIRIWLDALEVSPPKTPDGEEIAFLGLLHRLHDSEVISNERYRFEMDSLRAAKVRSILKLEAEYMEKLKIVRADLQKLSLTSYK